MRSGSGSSGSRSTRLVLGSGLDLLASSDEDSPLPSHSQPSLPSDHDDEDTADEGQFVFRRNRNNSYLPVRISLVFASFFIAQCKRFAILSKIIIFMNLLSVRVC